MTYVASSPIHGKGLFAKTRIDSGAYLGTYQGPQAKRNGSHVLWVYQDGDVVGRRGLNKLRYLNHCDRPNAEFDGFDLYALCPIEVDEEITINYASFGGQFDDKRMGTKWQHSSEFECFCKAKK